VDRGKDLLRRVVRHRRDTARRREPAGEEIHRLEAELRQLKDQAAAAHRVKAEFLANVNHELRTPLNAVIGFAELLERQLFGPLGHPHYVDYARMIRSSGDHLLRVITEIVDLSRSGAGLAHLDLRPVELEQVIGRCHRALEARATEAGIELAVESAPVPIVLADPARLEHAFLNLMANAIKFSPRGHAVRVSIAPHESGAAVTIADKGIGMSNDDLLLALEPFRQVDGSHIRRHQGIGLGLPVAKRLIEMHGGMLRIDSVPGHGTTITVVLPAHPGQPRAPDQPQGPRNGSPV
jgi:two-component system cell cycle sensor histidine kinase PleC